ncbi:MAG: DUF2807 domain-containing protein [Sandaracinaceae bacterium]|nr:DUF2807 domain-containing protein [Sandaracinaceae bacterium]
MRHLPSLLCALFVGCAPVAGDGVSLTETRDVGDFDGVAVEGALRVEVITGDPRALTVTTDANLMELVETVVEDHALQVRPAEWIEPTIPVEVSLGAATLDFLSARQTGSVALAHRVAAQRFGVAASDGATAQAGGTCEVLRAVASDHGSIQATSLVCADGRVDAQEGARIEVTVTGHLEVRASGESVVVIHGNPTEVERFVTDDSTLELVP